MSKSKYILIGKRLLFYSELDKKVFFAWIQRIQCITRITLNKNTLYLYMRTTPISERDLRNLLGMFYRYKIDMKQLKCFLTPQNQVWFYNNTKTY